MFYPLARGPFPIRGSTRIYIRVYIAAYTGLFTGEAPSIFFNAKRWDRWLRAAEELPGVPDFWYKYKVNFVRHRELPGKYVRIDGYPSRQ